MAKIEFTTRDTIDGKEFICSRCSGEVAGLAEKQYARQRPYMMECRRCGLVSGSWDTDDEVRKDGRVVIAFNPSHHDNRKRFTIAHELGHYCFHAGVEEHVDKEFRVSWRRVDDSPSGVDWQEVTANRFAAELLMPTRFIIRRFHS